MPEGTREAELATPVRSTAAGTASWYVDYAQASLNGFWGDAIARKNRRLDVGMTLRHHGRHLPATPDSFGAAFPNPTPKLCVFVHGLAGDIAAGDGSEHTLVSSDLLDRLPEAMARLVKAGQDGEEVA